MNVNIFPVDFDRSFMTDYVKRQLDNFFPDNTDNKNDISGIMGSVLDRLEFSLKHVKITTHQKFSVLHSDLYAQFLYFLSNTAWREGKINLAQKAYYLNKALHSLNCMYDTDLPDIFLFFHIVGTVLGKAKYHDFLVVNQGVTVGTNKNISPTIEKAVMLRPGCSVLGNTLVGEYSVVSANALILDMTIPEKSIVFGSVPNLIIKPAKRLLIKEEIFFDE